MIKTIFKHLLALTLSVIISTVGILSVGVLINIPQEDPISWKWAISFTLMYFVIIRPIAKYWSEVIYNLLDISTKHDIRCVTRELDTVEKNKQHLLWLYNRMVEIHGENPNVDYMSKMKQIIDNQ